MKIRHFLFLSLSLFFYAPAFALQAISLSGMGMYSRVRYNNSAESVTRRYTAAIGVLLTSITEIEFSYTRATTDFQDDPIQTNHTEERIMSGSLVQTLVPSSWVVQPYVKLGGAHYVRKQSGTIYGVATEPTESRSPSALIGGGMRFILSSTFSIKGEVVSIVPHMHWKDAENNVQYQVGVGIQF